MKNILVINTGGTFNKVYNERKGHLEVSANNHAIEKIINKAFKDNLDIKIIGMLYKDSIKLVDEDRYIMMGSMKNYDKVLIIHGTDTMDITATFLAKFIKNKTIILTGAMKPFSIEPIEATANFSIALEFLKQTEELGIFIGMHGLVDKHYKIKKNRILGRFELRN